MVCELHLKKSKMEKCKSMKQLANCVRMSLWDVRKEKKALFSREKKAPKY